MSNSSTPIAYINNTSDILHPKNAMKFQNKYGYGVLKIIILSLQLTYQKNTILKQTGFLENLTIIQNGNLIVRYLSKLLISLATQKLIVCYQNKYTTSKLYSLVL